NTVNVLHNINLEVNKGEIVSLVGLNGAGKTTLLKTISGIIQAKKGNVFFEGKDVTNVETHELVKKGLVHVPESRLLFSSLTVEENLILGSVTQKRQQRKDKNIKQLKFIYNLFPVLEKRSKQRAGTLSGGEQQMLAIGRGIMSEPNFLLL